MSKFTVEEINFMCVFETQDRTDMIGQIRQVMPHIVYDTLNLPKKSVRIP